MYASAKKMGLTIVIALTFIGSTIAQENSGISRGVGIIGYSGNYSPAQIMEAEASRILEIDSDAKIEFEISIPIMESGRVLISDTTGLPLHKPDNGSIISSASMVVPFHVSEFKQGMSFNSSSFYDHVSETLSQIPKSDEPQNKNSGSTLQSLNSPNCGGYPLGTTVTVTTDSCIFGTYTTNYSCNFNPLTFGKDWYVISTSWIPPTCMTP